MVSLLLSFLILHTDGSEFPGYTSDHCCSMRSEATKHQGLRFLVPGEVGILLGLPASGSELELENLKKSGRSGVHMGGQSTEIAQVR